MTMLGSHIVLMFLYAVAAGLFFALLWKHDRGDRIRLFVIIFCSLFFGGVVLSWLMYPFPMK
jgi:predicted transporter